MKRGGGTLRDIPDIDVSVSESFYDLAELPSSASTSRESQSDMTPIALGTGLDGALMNQRHADVCSLWMPVLSSVAAFLFASEYTETILYRPIQLGG